MRRKKNLDSEIGSNSNTATFYLLSSRENKTPQAHPLTQRASGGFISLNIYLFIWLYQALVVVTPDLCWGLRALWLQQADLDALHRVVSYFLIRDKTHPLHCKLDLNHWTTKEVPSCIIPCSHYIALPHTFGFL